MKLRSRLPILAAIALPLLGVAIAPSFAQSSSQLLTQQRVNCDSPQTTTEMNICAGREYQVADRKLNSVYQALKSKLSGQQQKRMTDAQLVWIKFRDATCAYERGQFEGGTMAGPVRTSCLARITQERTKELEGYLQDINNR